MCPLFVICTLGQNTNATAARIIVPRVSTITYDTLVRGGIACTSAFVPDREGEPTQTKEGEGLVATCSRGVRITADVGLESVQKDQVCAL